MAKSELISFKEIVSDIAKAQNKWSKATKVTATSLKNMAKDLSKAEQSAKKFNKSQQLSVADSKSLDKILKKLGSTITRNINTSIKSAEADKKAAIKAAEAARKAAKAVEKRINAQRKAINQSEAVRRNLLLKAEAFKKVKQQQDLDIYNSKRSNAANIKYEKTLKRLNRSLFTFAKSTHQGAAGVRNLRNASVGGGMALSVLRSKLLIVAFGANLVSRSVGALVKSYGQQEAAEMKVRATLASTRMAAGMTFREIQKLTQELQRNGVVGDEVNLQMASLMLTYDQIGRKTFPAAMKAANDMATSLAMGIPTAEELKSTVTMLSKALQDPERGMAALRKVGFSLNAVQEKQVKTFIHLGKTAKAQNIILKAAEKQYGNMAKIIATSTLGQLNAMTMAMGDMSEEMGKALAPMMLNVAELLKFIAERLDPSSVRGFTMAIVALGGAFGISRVTASLMAFDLKVISASAAGAAVTMDQLTRAQARFNIVARRNPYILIALSIASLIPALVGLSGGFKTAKDEAQGLADAQLNLINRTRIFDNELTKQIAEDAYQGQKEKLDELNDVTAEWTEKTEEQTKQGKIIYTTWVALKNGQEMSRDVLIDLISYQEKQVEQAAKNRDSLSQDINLLSVEDQHVLNLIKSYEDKQAVLKIQGEAYDTFAKKALGLNRAEDLNLKTQLNLQKAASHLDLSLKQLIDTYPELTKLIGDFTEEQQKQNLELKRAQEIANLEAEIRAEAFGLMAQFADAEIAKQNEIMQNDINNTKQTSAYKRAQKRGDNAEMLRLEKEAMKATLPDRKKAAQQKLGLAVADIALSTAVAIMKAYKDYGPVAGHVPAALMATLGVLQTASAIKANPIPKFGHGGLIGGSRHSQGGTMINAEQGEFVMNRSAVQSAGIETMNRINQGGSTSSVTVNVSGNVLSQDFVEGELAENIKEAIRRGTDFGIS